MASQLKAGISQTPVKTAMLVGATAILMCLGHPGRAAAGAAAAPSEVYVAQACEAKPSGAVEIVDRLHAALLAVMREAKQLGFAGRKMKLDPVVRGTFDLATMVRTAVGMAWDSATSEQRARLHEAFARMSVATYARRFDGYSGEKFENLRQDPGPRESTWVRTRLVRPDDDPVSLSYLTRHTCDKGWRIVDVYLGGTISEMAIRRSEYTSVIRQSGVGGLVAALEKKSGEPDK